MRAGPGYLLVCLLASILLIAAGCGSDDDGGSASETATTGTTATTSTETTTDEDTTTTTETDDDEDNTTTTGTDTSTTNDGDDSDDNGNEGGGGADVDRIAFRTAGNRVVCGTDERGDRLFLVCFQPESGATVRLGPSGVPKSSLSDDNEGVPAGARGAPVIRKGQPIRVDSYRCVFVQGSVRCTNPRRHGFLIGGVSIFRF